MNRNEKAFKGKFIEFLDEHGTNVKQVHEKTGIPLMTMYDWKAGRTEPGIGYIKKITEAYELPSGYFLE